MFKRRKQLKYSHTTLIQHRSYPIKLFQAPELNQIKLHSAQSSRKRGFLKISTEIFRRGLRNFQKN